MKTLRWISASAVVILIISSIAWLLLNIPLASGLELTLRSEQATDTNNPPGEKEIEDEMTSAPPASSAMAQNTPTPTNTRNNGTCGQKGTMTVLLIGEGILDGDIWYGASAIRVVKVDFDAKSVRVLALPPELWVDTPALAKAQITATTQITATVLDWSYFEAKRVYSGTERAKMSFATNILAQTLVDNFDLTPDHYISMKQEAVRDMVNTLGGLSINLPKDVDTPFGYYPAGEQVLDGQEVVDYVRFFAAKGDPAPSEWKRIARQKQVLKALYAQLIQPETLPKLPDLAREFHEDVVTDLSVAQALTLVCMLQNPKVTIEYFEIGPELVTAGSNSILYPNMKDFLKFLQTEFLLQ